MSKIINEQVIFMNELENLRKEIDEIDQEICKLFEKRMGVSKKIGEYKKSNSMNVLDVSRENIVIENAKKRLKNKELEEYYLTVVKCLMDVSKKYQNK
jgi:monofunctional chorismate mutase